MLIAHKIIECLERGKSLYVPGVSQEDCLNAAQGIRLAQKFDFGKLHIEKVPDVSPPTYLVSELTLEEREFWRLGLIPLPYPICWYEFELGRFRSGLLVSVDENNDRWVAFRVDYIAETDTVTFDNIRIYLSRLEAKEEEGWKAKVGGNKSLYDAFVQKGLDSALNCRSMMPLAIYFTMMLVSKTTEIIDEPEPTKLNKKRRQSGKEPVSKHTIVNIVPSKYRYVKDHQGGTHRSPRLHWRRSHLRHYEHPTPNSKFVENATYKGRTGWHIAVIARMLVGSRELGEISHEYKITGEE